MIEIYVVSISLSHKKRVIIRSLGFFNETKKTYRNKNNQYPEPKSINKEKILSIDTVMVNSISCSKPYLCYKTYCKKENEEEAINLLLSAIDERVKQLKEGLDYLLRANSTELIKDKKHD